MQVMELAVFIANLGWRLEGVPHNRTQDTRQGIKVVTKDRTQGVSSRNGSIPNQLGIGLSRAA